MGLGRQFRLRSAGKRSLWGQPALYWPRQFSQQQVFNGFGGHTEGYWGMRRSRPPSTDSEHKGEEQTYIHAGAQHLTAAIHWEPRKTDRNCAAPLPPPGGTRDLLGKQELNFSWMGWIHRMNQVCGKRSLLSRTWSCISPTTSPRVGF